MHKDLQGLIDSELEAAGFSKEAFNPFMSKDRDRSSVSNSPSKASEVDDDIPTRTDDEDGRAGSTQKVYRNPSAVLAKSSSDLRKRVKDILQKKASKDMGLRSPEEALQAFTSSEVLNKIKVGSMARRLLGLVPEELGLSLTNKLQGIIPHGEDLQALFAGRALRSAAQVGDVEKTRRLYESLGGYPSIGIDELMELYRKSKGQPSLSAYIKPLLGGAAIGGGLGYAAGAGRPQEEATDVRLY